MAARTAVEAMDSSLVMREGRPKPLGLFSAGVEGMLPKLGGLVSLKPGPLPCLDCTYTEQSLMLQTCSLVT